MLNARGSAVLLCMTARYFLPVILPALYSIPSSHGCMMEATGGLGMLLLLPGMSA